MNDGLEVDVEVISIWDSQNLWNSTFHGKKFRIIVIMVENLLTEHIGKHLKKFHNSNNLSALWPWNDLGLWSQDKIQGQHIIFQIIIIEPLFVHPYIGDMFDKYTPSSWTMSKERQSSDFLLVIFIYSHFEWLCGDETGAGQVTYQEKVLNWCPRKYTKPRTRCRYRWDVNSARWIDMAVS